jgi:choline-sulfatase
MPGATRFHWAGTALALSLLACSPPTKASWETVHDLAALFPVAEMRREVSGLDIGSREARASLVSGWSRNEVQDGMSFVWSQGEASAIEFFLSASRDLQVAIRCAPLPASGPAQTMRVEINGHGLGQVVMAPGMREYVIGLPRTALVTGMNRLAFRYRTVSEPSPDNGHRRLAVQWDALRLRPARQPEPPRGENGALYLPFGTGLVYYLDVPAAGELAVPRMEVRGTAGGHLEVSAQEEGGEAEVHELEPGPQPQAVKLPGRRAQDVHLVRLDLRAVAPASGADGGLWMKAPAVRAARSASSDRAGADRSRPWTGRPNVIVYLVDALRADRLGCYGGARPTSPAVDAFAKGATRFERAVAQATWTRPSVTSLLTGLGPHAHGVQTLDDRLPDSAVTLPELLRAAGYRTAAFSTNLHVSAATGLAQGFADFELLADAPSSEIVNRRVLGWLDAHPATSGAPPFFLYIHTIDPHAPYEPPVEMLQRFAPGVLPSAGSNEEMRRTFAMPNGDERVRRVAQLSALYDAEVAGNDRSFGALLAELRRRGLYDSSLLIFVADHGEEFDEHGFLGHANNLYAETLDVPLIVKWPRQTRGERVPALAQHVDLLPTILRACGLRPPDGLPGTDLFNLAAGRKAFSHLSYDGRDGMSVVADGWKLILPFSRKLGSGPELYRRETDRDDQNDLSESDEVRTGWLRTQIRLELLRTRPPEAERAPVDDETRKALEALGYQ